MIISLDLESNGLMGQAFCLAASIWQAGQEVGTCTARCPITGPVDPWVAEHVLPAIAHIPEDIGGYAGLLAGWRHLYTLYTPLWATVTVITHLAWPVEAQFLLDAHPQPFSGPYPLLDVASMLHQAGEDPTSVDTYLAKHGIQPPGGTAHDPLYDARASALAYHHLTREDKS